MTITDQKLLARLQEQKSAEACPVSWLPCTVIRPHFGTTNSREVELANALKQKRVVLSRKALLAILALALRKPSKAGTFVLEQLHNLELISNDSIDSETLAGIDHWQKYNWTYALDYYLWSRRWEFFDEGVNYQNRQEDALRSFLTEEGSPSARKAGIEGQSLAPFAELPDDPLGKVLFRRAAAQDLPERQLSQAHLSSILWHGLKSIRKYRHPNAEINLREFLRSFGSAFEIFFAAYNIEGLTPGIYFYDVSEHTIKVVREGNFRNLLQKCLIGQSGPLTAACTLLFVAEFHRYQWRYRHERALRDLYLHVAWLAHHVILVATAYHLAIQMTPAVQDSAILDLLALDRVREQVLYTLSIG